MKSRIDVTIKTQTSSYKVVVFTNHITYIQPEGKFSIIHLTSGKTISANESVDEVLELMTI